MFSPAIAFAALFSRIAKSGSDGIVVCGWELESSLRGVYLG